MNKFPGVGLIICKLHFTMFLVKRAKLRFQDIMCKEAIKPDSEIHELKRVKRNIWNWNISLPLFLDEKYSSPCLGISKLSKVKKHWPLKKWIGKKAACLTSWTSSGFFLEIICVKEGEEKIHVSDPYLLLEQLPCRAVTSVSRDKALSVTMTALCTVTEVSSVRTRHHPES